MDILGIAQQGLDQAQGQFDQTAQRIAQTSLHTGPAQADSVSLSDEAVTLIGAKNDYQTNLSVAHVADEMQQETLNLLV
jgi:flagellar basal body rod protein FlgC